MLPAQAADQAADQTIRSGIREILRRCGPLRFVDLRTEAVKVLGRKHVHSVGPILLTSGTFIRPLPGVYALPDQLPTLSDLAFSPPAFILNEEQARWIAMARFAGEPFGSFPLWQPAVEYALCRWGETKANPIVWQSLVGELQETGKLVWDSAIGADLILKLQEPVAFRDSAWLTSPLIVELRSVAEHNPIDRLSVPAENDDDALSFAKLLEDVARQKQLAEAQEYIFDT